MTQLIDKSALVAEIEKKRDAALTRQRNLEAIGQVTVINKLIANELNRILSFIDTLEVKEVDLEKEVEKYLLTNATFLIGGDSKLVVHHIAKHFFELGMAASNKGKKGE